MTDSNFEQDGWIVATHPDPNNSWMCVTCKTVFPTNRMLWKHLRTTHQITKICYKCLCGVNSENSRSVSPQKHCCTRNPPEEHGQAIKCSHSRFSTKFESGLSVHIARVHPSIHNEILKEKTKNFLWSEPELRLLAETITEPKSKKVKDVNLVASNILGTSSQAIQKIRPKSEYKLVENHIKNKLSVEQNPQVNVEQTPLPSVDIQSVKPSPQQTPLRLTCIGNLHKSKPTTIALLPSC